MALNRVGDLASRYYISGPSHDIGALLVSAKPDTLTEQLTMLDRLAAQERKQVEGCWPCGPSTTARSRSWTR